ncbi:MAG: glycosyltransferase family 39 protein [Dehalococcoidia bacterium]
MGAILLTAFAARLAWVFWVGFDPEIANIDARVYHLSAQQFAAGCGYCEPRGDPAIFFPPGYPGFLGILYWVFGSHALVGQIANALLTTLNAGLVFLIARQAYDGRWAAVAAAALYAFLPSNAMFSSLLMSEPLFTTMLLLVLLLALRGAPPIVVGALVGLSALVRGQGLVLLVPVTVLAVLRSGWRPSLRQYVLPMAIAALIVLVPWTVRNYVQFDSFVLISTGQADALYRGNRDGAQGPPLSDPADREELRDPIEAYDYKMDVVRNFIRDNPLSFFVTLPPRKLYYMYDADSFHVFGNRVASPRQDNAVAWQVVGQVTQLGYGSLFALAVVSAPVWYRRTPEAVMLVVLFGVWTLAHLAFFGFGRFHFPVMPVWAIWAGTGVAVLWSGARQPEEPNGESG